jgi:hypothetical protein
MAKYLVTFNDQINEIEVYGFRLMTDKEVENLEDLASSIAWSFTYPLNSGDELEFLSGDDYLTKLEFKEITNEEFKAIKKAFGSDEFGIFIGEESLEHLIEEEDEDFDDEEDEDNDYNDKDYRDTDFYSDDDEF